LRSLGGRSRFVGEKRPRLLKQGEGVKIEKILLVDDDPTVRKLATMSLERVGKWQVVSANSGSEALSLLPSVRPDLVILDVMMPKLDGMSTLKKLRAIPDCEKLPVILMTAKMQDGDISADSDIDIAGIIFKPFDPMTLPQEIRKILEQQEVPK
jgi:CheY-like chemotaxis protein